MAAADGEGQRGEDFEFSDDEISTQEDFFTEDSEDDGIPPEGYLCKCPQMQSDAQGEFELETIRALRTPVDGNLSVYEPVPISLLGCGPLTECAENCTRFPAPPFIAPVSLVSPTPEEEYFSSPLSDWPNKTFEVLPPPTDTVESEQEAQDMLEDFPCALQQTCSAPKWSCNVARCTPDAAHSVKSEDSKQLVSIKTEVNVRASRTRSAHHLVPTSGVELEIPSVKTENLSTPVKQDKVKPESVKQQKGPTEARAPKRSLSSTGRSQSAGGAAKKQRHRERRSTGGIKDEEVIWKCINQGLRDGHFFVRPGKVHYPEPGAAASFPKELIEIEEREPGLIFMKACEAILRADTAKDSNQIQEEFAWLRHKVLQHKCCFKNLAKTNSLGKESDPVTKRHKQALARAYVTPAEYEHLKKKGTNPNGAKKWRSSIWKVPQSCIP